MLATNLSRKRVNNVLNILSKLLRYALELEIVGKIPIGKTLKVPPQKFDFFTDDELERLIDTAKGEPEGRTAIILAADGGLQMGELGAAAYCAERHPSHPDGRVIDRLPEPLLGLAQRLVGQPSLRRVARSHRPARTSSSR